MGTKEKVIAQISLIMLVFSQQNLLNDPVSVVAGPAYGIFVFKPKSSRCELDGLTMR